jgi:hypothetical protein
MTGSNNITDVMRRTETGVPVSCNYLWLHANEIEALGLNQSHRLSFFQSQGVFKNLLPSKNAI